MAIPIRGPRATWRRRVFIFFTCIIAFLVLVAILFAALQYIPGIHLGNLFNPGTNGIGVTTVGNNEHIGISNGTYIFDTGLPRKDVDLKTQAASALSKGDNTKAASLWEQAVEEDTNDGEAHIYQEDMRVLASHKPYITLVVGTMLTGDSSDLSTGRDTLQGAYVAQKEYNDGAKLGQAQVYLLIASAGSNSDYATKVAQQVVQAAQHDSHIVGVMGWPYSSYVQKAYTVLANAHIPMISPTASSDQLTGISPYFFRIVPSNNIQAVAGAQYAAQYLNARRAALFVDPTDTYSESLANDFKAEFQKTGSIVDTEIYKEKVTGNLGILLQKALTTHPDLIYFAGYAADMSVLLANLDTSQPIPQLMGGDALYQLEGYASSARAGFEHLHFTTFAYPDEWGYLGLKSQQPIFFTNYAFNFNPSGSLPGTYGYGRPDNDAILSYDATIALLQGCVNALAGRTSLTPDELRQGISKITGPQAIQGVSGQIAFRSDGDPSDKAIVILEVDASGHIKLASKGNAILNCFQLSKCSSS